MNRMKLYLSKDEQVVSAMLIEGIREIPMGGYELTGEGFTVMVDGKWNDKHRPKKGGYFVKKSETNTHYCDPVAFHAWYSIVANAEMKKDKRKPLFAERTGKFVKALLPYRLNRTKGYDVWGMKVEAIAMCSHTDHVHLISLSGSSEIKYPIGKNEVEEVLKHIGRKPMFVKHPDGREELVNGEQFLKMYTLIEEDLKKADIADEAPLSKKMNRSELSEALEQVKKKPLFVDANGVDVRTGEEVYLVNKFGEVTPMLADDYDADYGFYQKMFMVGILKSVHKDRAKAEESAKEQTYVGDKLWADYQERKKREKQVTGDIAKAIEQWAKQPAEIYSVTETKTMSNTDANGAKKNVKDIQFFGDGDTFKLICKASSEAEGWMKSTKAMDIAGVGCVVQVTTQQRNIDGTHSIAEAVTFVPNVVILQHMDNENNVIGRELIPTPLEGTPIATEEVKRPHWKVELDDLQKKIFQEAEKMTFGRSDVEIYNAAEAIKAATRRRNEILSTVVG